jgi:hypothetical protein
MAEPMSRRLKRWAWACADVAFHLFVTLIVVVLGLIPAISAEIADTWHGLCKMLRNLKE